MRLTKSIIDVLKYHGYMTLTENSETFLKVFNTVEELGEAGFIEDRGTIEFLKTIFTEDGSSAIGPAKDEDINKSLEQVEEPKSGTVEEVSMEQVEEQNPETETETPITDPVEEKVETETETPIPTPEFEQEKVNELVGETPAPEPEPEPEKIEEKVEEQAEVKPKPKKTTTKKKSTEKES